MPPPGRIYNLRGKPWRLIYADPRSRGMRRLHGYALPSARKPGGTIRVSRGMDEKMLLETLLHEALHACYWDMDEAAISEAARDLAELLLGEGWRLSG